MMLPAVYLDHAGAGQYLPEQIEASMRELTQSQFGNPHSQSASSKLATDMIDQVRYRILEHFGTTADLYTLIFTSGCTAALKLVAECLDWNTRCEYCKHNELNPQASRVTATGLHSKVIGPTFVYLMDNHTSAVGMREYPLRDNASVQCIRPDEVDQFLTVQQRTDSQCQCVRIFVFPAQSNFCGRKYVCNRWIDRFHALSPPWLVCLDAAALVSTSPYNMNTEKPDFVTLSFYKIFGYPTGLGALLVRNDTAGTSGLLKKKYFGGGSVKVVANRSNFVSFRDDISERFEDGTVAYQQILALRHGFEALTAKGGIDRISLKAFSLAKCAYHALTTVTHFNGAPIAKVYCHNKFTNQSTQGPIVNFNLLRPDGSYVGFAEADKMAELYNINWRTGCFCNQGACQMYLNLDDETLMENFESGKVCGDTIDIVNSQPVGSIRISFGWTSTLSDVVRFIRMIWDCFLQQDSGKKFEEALAELNLPNWLDAVQMPVTRDSGMQMTPRCKDDAIQNGPLAEEFFDALDYGWSVQGAINGETIRPNGRLVLTDVCVYPIKSCGAWKTGNWRISERGLNYDRRWMVVTEESLCLNQKREPRLCLIRPNIDLDQRLLILRSSCSGTQISVPLDMVNERGVDAAITGPYCQSKVCADRVSTIDCGDEAGRWIDRVVGRSGCRLVKQTDHIERRRKSPQHAKVSLVNEEQYLLLHRPSIRRLLPVINEVSPKITEDELIMRFRPNLVIDGGQPFEEDAWKELTVGNIKFQCVGKCTRCQMICVDQQTGQVSTDVLLALRNLRDNKTTFGIYLQAAPDQIGQIIAVGQKADTSC